MNPYISDSIRFHKTIFLSDFHIGAKAFDSEALLSFLKFNECETMYLVGDIIDGWKLTKRWHWDENTNKIFDEIARKVDHGMKLIYLPGNHDEEVRTLPLLRKLRFSRRMNVTIRNRMVHKCADGRKFLVMHGDQFDRRLISGRVSQISDRLYDLFLDLINGHSHTQILIDGELKKFSLAKYLSKQGQKALHFLNNFESAVVREARSEGVHGIICGHTHIPALKRMADITYANCGSWLRLGHTALVEDTRGNLSLVDWPAHEERHDPQTAFSFMTQRIEDQDVSVFSDCRAYRPVTLKLVQTIRRTWPVRTFKEETSQQDKNIRCITLLKETCFQEMILQTVQGDIRVNAT